MVVLTSSYIMNKFDCQGGVHEVVAIPSDP